MENFQREERHAVLIFDEMAIKPGMHFDNSLSKVVGSPTLSSTKTTTIDEMATHAMVYMLRGVSTNWKQIVGYDFTSNSINTDELNSRLMSIINKTHEIGITVRAIVSDMGPQNR